MSIGCGMARRTLEWQASRWKISRSNLQGLGLACYTEQVYTWLSVAASLTSIRMPMHQANMPFCFAARHWAESCTLQMTGLSYMSSYLGFPMVNITPSLVIERRLAGLSVKLSCMIVIRFTLNTLRFIDVCMRSAQRSEISCSHTKTVLTK